MEGFIQDFLWGTFDLLWKMLVIVVPIMVILELAEGTRFFAMLTRLWTRLMGPLGFTRETAAPTLVGFLFGLAYGSGVILREVRRGTIGRRQVFLMSLFLSMVHSIVEDSLIMFAVGASLVWIVGFRILWAALITLAIGAAATAWVRRRRGDAGSADL